MKPIIYLILSKIHQDETSIMGSYQTEELAYKDLINKYGTDDYYIYSVVLHESDNTDDAKSSNTATIVEGVTSAIETVGWLLLVAYMMHIYK